MGNRAAIASGDPVMADEPKIVTTEIAKKTRRAFVKTAAQVAVTAPAVVAATSGPMPPAGSVPAPPKTEPLAILSLIFSVLGLFGFCCGFFLMLAIAGVVCGHLALSKFKKNPELQGHGLALSGVIIGYAAIAGWLIWILLFGGLAVLQGITESMKSKP